MFFLVPDDLANLDIQNGQCYNSSIKQNVTFGYQGLPFGIGSGASSIGTRLNLAFAFLIGSIVWNLL